MSQKTAIIIGAGPAGLTAAHELLEKTSVKPVILESTDMIGGIARTVNYKGNRIDLGGHRFFSRSDTVMNWWLKVLPLQDGSSGAPERSPKDAAGPSEADKVMLLRNRLSRIFYLRKFFNYPLSLDLETVSNLGLGRTFRVGASYLKTKLSPARREETLEDFFINRFGHELYRTFFKDYTEKVWGIACDEISAEWGAQRIKGLSVTRALLHAIKKLFKKDSSIGQKGTDTSLIERFLYPKYGPGQLWEEVADKIRRRGGEIRMECRVTGVDHDGAQVESVTYWDEAASCFKKQECDYLFSSMPVDELISAMGSSVPAVIQEVSAGLEHRDFMTVGLLVKRFKAGGAVANSSRSGGSTLIRDNWIYIQERDVKIGRLQIFNNWSPFMVKDREKVWLGLEYFCDEGDEMWRMADEAFVSFAAEELAKIGMIDKDDVLDSVLIRQRKAYPAYFGSYDRFGEIRKYLDSFANMFLVGRNGMHKYNNQDHSMLTAMAAVENVQRGITSKDNIWAINAEEEYHEEKGDTQQVPKAA